MYKLVIADDEKMIREGLARLLDWEGLGFEVVGTFSDGEQVIEYLDNMPVDVILTDIIMMHLSGIDIAKYIKEKGFNTKVVFITGHKDFELALQAIRYDVKDYILKPSKVEDVTNTFEKIRLELDENYKDIEFQNRLKQQWKEMYPVMKEKFVNDLMMGTITQEDSILPRLKLLYPDVDYEKCSCILVEMEIRDYEKYIRQREYYSAEQLDEAIYNFTDMFPGRAYFHIVYKCKGQLRFFVLMKDYCIEERENLILCRFQIEQFSKEFSEIFKTGIEPYGEKIYRNIHELRKLRENHLLMESPEDNFQEAKKLIFTNLMAGNIGSAQRIMKSMLTGPAVGGLQRKNHFVIDVFSGICELLREKNPKLLKNIAPFIDYRMISNMENPKELELYCERIFNKMKSKEGLSTQFNNNSLVNQIKQYVAEHIYEDVMLETVANQIYISTTHLSRVFKKHTGETFLQYVTRKKMEKAAELLAYPEMMVYQIGERLGYHTPRYFSKLFYNYSGFYPNQYRREVLQMKEIQDEESES